MSLKESGSDLPATSISTGAARPVQKGGRVDWLLLGVLSLALLVRLYAWWQAPRVGFVADEAEYYSIGSMLADGRGWAFYDEAVWVRPPLYPLLLGAVFRLFGPNLIVVRLIQLTLSVASVYLLYRLGRRVFGRPTGLVAGLLAALAWPFALFSYLLLSETLFFFLFLTAVNFLVAATAKEVETRSKESQASGMASPLLAVGSPPPLKLAAFRGSALRFSALRLFGGGFRSFLFYALAGLFLGLAALTRGQVLSFVPFVGLWLWFGLGWRNWRRALLIFGLVAVVFGITVGPWAWRNFAAYGRPLIDTTGGYNFYLGALHGRNEVQVAQTLQEVQNQADREGLGYRKGLEILARDPLDFGAKGLKESLDFWNLNFGADERLIKGYTKGAVSPAWLLPDFLLGDTLYLLVVPLAGLGLLAVPRKPGGLGGFVVAWLGYNMVLAFAFFAVSRFRASVYFFLLLFAAYVLANPREVRRWLGQPLLWSGRKLWPGRWLALAVPLLLGLVCLLSYDERSGEISLTYRPDATTFLGVDEWGKAQRARQGDELRLAGRYAESLAAYVTASPSNPATQIGIGLAEAALGRYDAAISRIERLNPEIAQAHLALGWIHRLRGNDEYASAEFRTRSVALDPTADHWAWDNLAIKPLPDNRLTLGVFDWGYVEGFHSYEKEDDKRTTPYFRWTADRGESGQEPARLRFLLEPASRPRSLSLYLNGYRPAGLTPPAVEVRAGGRVLGHLQTVRGWQTYTLPLPADLNFASPLVIELLPSSTFVPGAASRRELGVMVQWASLNP